MSVPPLGAGSSLWAALLRRRGVAVAAYDAVPWVCEAGFGEVQRGGPERVGRHADASLLLCWPPLEASASGSNTMGVRALRAMTGRGALRPSCG